MDFTAIFTNVITGIILIGIGALITIFKLPFTKYIENYLDSKAGKRQILSIMESKCDDRHKDEKDNLMVQFAALKKEISAMRLDFKEENTRLYNLITDTKCEILDIYKNLHKEN